MKDVSKKIKRIMDIYDISYGDIAWHTDIPKSAVHRYVTGETEKIPLNRLEKIAKYLNINVAYLLGWDESKNFDYVDQFHKLGYRFSEEAKNNGFYTIDSYADYVLNNLKSKELSEKGEDPYRDMKNYTDIALQEPSSSNETADMLKAYDDSHKNDLLNNIISGLEGLDSEYLNQVLQFIILVRNVQGLSEINVPNLKDKDGIKNE